MKASPIVGVGLLCALTSCSLINAPDDVKLSGGANLGGSGDGGQSASTSSGFGTNSSASASTGAGGAGGTSSATSSTASGTGSGGGAPTDLYREAVMADGPVAYWRFGETAGVKAKNEVSGSPDGTYTGLIGITYGDSGIPGSTDTAVKLDGKYGCIVVGDYFMFAGRDSFSVESWVNVSAYSASSSFGSNTGSMIASTVGSPLQGRVGWDLIVSESNAGYPVFDGWDDPDYVMGAYSFVHSGSVLSRNIWHHVVGVYSDTSEQLWIDGLLRDNQNQSSLPLPKGSKLTLGCGFDGVEDVYMGLVGRLDEVAIYDKALTGDQIRSHHAAGTKPVAP